MLLCATPVWGANYNWNSGGSDTEWATTANWDSGIVPGTNQVDVGLLGSSSSNATVTVDLNSSNQFVVRMRNGATLDVSADFGLAREFDIATTGGRERRASPRRQACCGLGTDL